MGFPISAVIFLFVFCSAIKIQPDFTGVKDTIKQQYLKDCKELQKKAEIFTAVMEVYKDEQIPLDQIKNSFQELKKSYKRIEYFIEYLDPDLAKKMNGPPIAKVIVEHQPYLNLKFREPVFTTQPPQGLQVLEEIVFNNDFSPKKANEALIQAYLIEENILLFINSLYHQKFTDKHFIESFREQILRLMTLGITGFDTPLAGLTIEKTTISLEPIFQALKLYYLSSTGDFKDQISRSLVLLENTLSYLQQNNDFDTLDRMYFIRELADPTYGALTKLQENLGSNTSSRSYFSKPVNDMAKSLFDIEFLNPGFYAKQDQKNLNLELQNLGKLLFFDPVLSSNNQRSCASCHNPTLAFTDGRIKSLAFDFKGNVRRNAPTLINSIFSTIYFWDGRTEYVQDQIPDVLSKADELHETYEEVVIKLNQSPEYKQLFKRAFQGQTEKEINANTINRAIAAYIKSLVALNAPFDQYMRKETNDLNIEAIRGFNLFMGKASCGTCHFAPIFNGTIPPRFIESETEVLGVPLTADLTNPQIDIDSGRAEFIKADVLLHSFKTTTVRNASLTAPYMHNGVFATLEEVIEFYDLGGGQGLGLEVPNQTLPPDPLNLSPEEKKDLVAFMMSLTDTATTTSIPSQLPSFPKNSKLNKRKVGGDY